MEKLEISILKGLGFKKCRLLHDAYSLNGFIATKHSYYWSLKGDFPSELCKTYEDDVNIRFTGSSNSIKEFELAKSYRDFMNDLLDKDVPYAEYKSMCESFNVDEGKELIIEDLHIDSTHSLIKVVKDIKRLNLRMEW